MLICNQITHNAETVSDTITLDETGRHRRRMKMISDNGIAFLLDLQHARLLRQGDGLLLEDGRVIEVRVAPEDLYEVTAEDGRHLLALAYQIGNRHLPCQISSNGLLIRRDHVIREMLEGLGARVNEISAPFNPEGGAYEHSHRASHHHTHDH